MADIKLFDGEYIVDQVNANYGVNGGKLFLTNRRVVFLSNIGKELWSVAINNIGSHFTNPIMGVYVDILIKSNEKTKSFRTMKKGGIHFENNLNSVINNTLKEDETVITDSKEDVKNKEGITGKVNKDTTVSSVSKGDGLNKKDSYSQQPIKYPVKLVVGAIFLSIVIIFLFIRCSQSQKASSLAEAESIAKEYVKSEYGNDDNGGEVKSVSGSEFRGAYTVLLEGKVYGHYMVVFDPDGSVSECEFTNY
ncbi:MAG: hypothetical protein IJF94_05640 [Eubacterium sp.]|nr:hypothetical protein [Eubacterium sp.]